MKKFIYGAGKYGQLLLQYFTSINEKIDYFVQTEEPDIKEIQGIPIISCKKMLSIDGKKTVFIAINNRKTAKEIGRNIHIANSCNTKVYQYSDFIDDNLLMNVTNIELQGKNHCIVCGNNPNEFLAAGTKGEIFKHHHIIGGGYRENCICPCCGTDDRGRWLYHVLQNKLKFFEQSGRILHFAPEKVIYYYMKQNEKVDYYTCDINQGKAMHIVDITDIQFRNDSFDYIISNHVMEHIMDEEKAVSEIKRVLKPNGKWIFSFPICMDMKTYENEVIVSPEDRLREYGQADHVRLYGYDYKERFEKYGLKLEIYSPETEISKEDILKYGFIKDDVIIIAEKQI